MKKNSNYGNQQIGTELDTFLRTNVVGATPSKEWLKTTKSEITKIVGAHFPKKTHQVFIEVWTYCGKFHALIGFRPFDKEKFGFINCSVMMENGGKEKEEPCLV